MQKFYAATGLEPTTLRLQVKCLTDQATKAPIDFNIEIKIPQNPIQILIFNRNFQHDPDFGLKQKWHT